MATTGLGRRCAIPSSSGRCPAPPFSSRPPLPAWHLLSSPIIWEQAPLSGAAVSTCFGSTPALHPAHLRTAPVWGRAHTCFCTRSASSLSHRSRSSSARRRACSSFSRACSASSLRDSSSRRLRSSATLRDNSSIFCLGRTRMKAYDDTSLKRGQIWQRQ